MRLIHEERGAAPAYLTFWVIVIVGALIWIIFNELVMHVADWVSTGAAQDPGFTWPILLSLYRAAPMVVIISAFLWAVVQTHRSSAVG